MLHLCYSGELVPNGENQTLFGNLIRSDGFSVDLVFYKRNETKNAGNSFNFDLKLEHFNHEEVQSSYCPIFIDPGRKSVFTAVSGLSTNTHTIMRCTTKEYYHYTGSTKYSATQTKLKKKKTNHIEGIESRIPTTKTSSADEYSNYMNYILQYLNKLFDFYNCKTAKYRFFLYQGKQRAPEILVNMLINGGSKYNRKRRKHNNKKKKRGRKKKKKAPNQADSTTGSALNTNRQSK